MTYNPTIQITQGENVGLTCSLDDFLVENEFDQEPTVADDIREALSLTGRYSDGGGAAPEWEIQVVRSEHSVGADDGIAEYMSHSDADPGL